MHILLENWDKDSSMITFLCRIYLDIKLVSIASPSSKSLEPERRVELEGVVSTSR